MIARVPRVVGLAILFVLSPSVARADIPHPARSSCYDHRVGDPCSYGERREGVCAPRRCLGRSGEPFDCVMCEVPGDADVAPSASADVELPTPLFASAPPATTIAAPSPSVERAPGELDRAPRAAPPAASAGCTGCRAGEGDLGDAAASGVFVALAVALLAREKRRATHRA